MLLDRALGRPKAAAEQRALEWEEAQALFRRLFLGGEELEVSRKSAERLSPVAAAHRNLSNSFGLIPFGVYRRNGEAREPVRNADLDRVLKERPNPQMSPYLCRKVLMSNAFWRGFGACWNQRDAAGRLTGRLPLPTECCSIRYDREVGAYWYDYDVDGVRRSFAAYELSLLYFETYDGVRGRGLLDLAREAVAADGMAQRYGKKFYQNGARITGVVELDTHAAPETREKVRKEFQRFSNQDAFAVAVLDHTMKYTPIGLNQRDAQFMESRAFSVEEISRFTGIPRHMLQTGRESYDSNAQQRLNYVTDTLLPYVVQWEQEDGYKLLTHRQRADGWYVRGNVEVLLRADPATRAGFYEKMIQNAVYCPDECRAKEEKNPIPGGLGASFLATKNLGALASILKGDA